MSNELAGDQMAKEYRFRVFDEMMYYRGVIHEIIESGFDVEERIESARVEYRPLLDRIIAYNQQQF